jgi:hypothetical protein
MQEDHWKMIEQKYRGETESRVGFVILLSAIALTGAVLYMKIEETHKS